MTSPGPYDVARRAPRYRRRIANRLGRMTIILLAGAGLAGVLGHLTGISVLYRPLAAWPPLPATVACALLALAMSATALLLFASSLEAPGGGLSVASALILGTASLALYVSVIERRPDVQQLTMVMAGLVLAALRSR
jgi:hypothetical protein